MSKKIKISGSKGRWRLIEMRSMNWRGLIEYAIKEFGIWEAFWGTDIFINDVPMLKLVVCAHIVGWILLWITK